MDIDMNNINPSINGPKLSQTTAIKCDNCDCEVFIPAYMLRKVSKLLIGAKNDGILPIDTFICAKCGHVNSEFLPEELKKSEKEKDESNLIV